MIGIEPLKPVVARAVWTTVMWLWLYATRITAMKPAGLDSATKVGGPGMGGYYQCVTLRREF